MANLVYSCVFFDEDYLALLKLLLKTFSMHDNSDTKYLIVTTSRFKPDIQEMFDENKIDGDIWCINTIYTQFAACCARLQIFSYPLIDQYSKILYLDTDILITNPLAPIFDIELEEKLYCYDAGITIAEWGNSKQLFLENNIDMDPNTPVFSTCTMLFKNCSRMKSLFSDTLIHIEERIPGDYDLDGAFEEKMKYNSTRHDHSDEG